MLFRSKGAVLPVIKVLFEMDNTGSSTNRHGIAIFDGSMAIVGEGCGCDNAGGDGFYAHSNCFANLFGANFRNAGNRGIVAFNASLINAQGCNAEGANSIGVYATIGSVISFQSGRARKGENNSSSDIRVAYGSTIVHTGSGRTGGYSQTPLEITENGIIYA